MNSTISTIVGDGMEPEIDQLFINIAPTATSVEDNGEINERFYCSMCGLSRTDDDPVYMGFNHIVVVIILPVIVLFGVAGNSLSAYVFTRRRMRCSANAYLTALAISDVVVELTAVFVFTFECVRHYNVAVRSLFLACVAYVYPLALWSQTCSVYMTVCAGVDCFIAVYWPKQRRRQLCNERRAHLAIVAVLVASFTYNFSHFLEVVVRQCYDAETNTTRDDVCMTGLRQNEDYNRIYYIYMYTIVMAVGPLLLLSSINVLIVVKVTRDQKPSGSAYGLRNFSSTSVVTSAGRLIQIASGVVGEPAPPPNTSDEGPVTLILVVLIFIICNSLGLILNFLELLWPEDLRKLLNYLVDVSNLLVVLNSSVNFLIYFSFSRKFRKTLRQCLRPSKKKEKQQDYTDFNASDEPLLRFSPRVEPLRPKSASNKEETRNREKKEDTRKVKDGSREIWKQQSTQRGDNRETAKVGYVNVKERRRNNGESGKRGNSLLIARSSAVVSSELGELAIQKSASIH